MPPRSKVDTLPDEVRSELERRLVENGFSNYEGLSDWLDEHGYSISKSAIHRKGQRMQDRLERLREATHVVREASEVFDDDEGKMGATAVMMAQSHLIELMMLLQGAQEETDPDARMVTIARASKAASELMRAEVAQKKWATQVRSRVEERFEKLEETARDPKSGLDPTTLRKIREEVYGIF